MFYFWQTHQYGDGEAICGSLLKRCFLPFFFPPFPVLPTFRILLQPVEFTPSFIDTTRGLRTLIRRSSLFVRFSLGELDAVNPSVLILVNPSRELEPDKSEERFLLYPLSAFLLRRGPNDCHGNSRISEFMVSRGRYRMIRF